MKIQNDLIISRSDYEAISSLLRLVSAKETELLEEELARALIVDEGALPSNVVSMNSVVSFEDLDNGKMTTITLVYPSQANLEMNKISILAPVGAALIGLTVGQHIDWPITLNKTRRLKVISVSKRGLKN